MDSHHKHVPGAAAPADYANSGYGYGYPGSGYGESTAQRSLNDYLLILRERIWYVVVVFLVVFSSALVYTFSQTKIYESSASVQILRQDPRVMQTEAVVDTTIRSTEDLNTLVRVMESALIIERVNQRITGEDLRQFMAPYGTPLGQVVLAVLLTLYGLALLWLKRMSQGQPLPRFMGDQLRAEVRS